MQDIPLYDLAHARTGDKGNIVNISLIAYREEDYPLLVEQVTPEARAPGSPTAIRRAALPAAQAGRDELRAGRRAGRRRQRLAQPRHARQGAVLPPAGHDANRIPGTEGWRCPPSATSAPSRCAAPAPTTTTRARTTGSTTTSPRPWRSTRSTARAGRASASTCWARWWWRWRRATARRLRGHHRRRPRLLDRREAPGALRRGAEGHGHREDLGPDVQRDPVLRPQGHRAEHHLRRGPRAVGPAGRGARRAGPRALGGPVRDELQFYMTTARPDFAKEQGFIGGKMPLHHGPPRATPA